MVVQREKGLSGRLSAGPFLSQESYFTRGWVGGGPPPFTSYVPTVTGDTFLSSSLQSRGAAVEQSFAWPPLKPFQSTVLNSTISKFHYHF